MLEIRGELVDVGLVLRAAGGTQASLPGYEWEARAAVEGAVWRHGSGAALLRGALRLVTVRDQDTLPRGDFAVTAAVWGRPVRLDWPPMAMKLPRRRSFMPECSPMAKATPRGNDAL